MQTPKQLTSDSAVALGRRSTIRIPLLIVVAAAVATGHSGSAAAPPMPERPNILLITLDDMNWDSVGAYGCPLENITPNIDSLALGGMRFEHAYVQTPSCVPSRNVFMTGRYPHTSGVMGFFSVKPSFATLPELLRSGGYYTAVVNKPRDSSMTDDFDRYWDYHQILPNSVKRTARNYADHTAAVLEAAAAGSKPFFCVVNIADPHKPFFEDPKAETGTFDKTAPSYRYTTADTLMPGFLPDRPKVREEMRNYYNSVKRGDDCVGAVLRVLREARLEGSTAVVLVSDHGMPLPYAKSSLYPAGLRTPWIVQWPGVAEAGGVDSAHLVSAVDFAPTVLDIASVPAPSGLQGKSMLPEIKGGSSGPRDVVFAEFNENAGGRPYPMRAVHTKEYVYVFNPWSDGERHFLCAANYYQSYKLMEKLAPQDDAIRARLDHLDHRATEELYDLAKDPDCLNNVIDSPAHSEAAERLRGELADWMRRTDDYALAAFQVRDDPAALRAFNDRLEADALERSKTVKWKRWKNRNGAVGKRDKVYVHN
ncbi:MAG: sulfatase [Planctomycetota bacterium]